jgi:hypothetical protein
MGVAGLWWGLCMGLVVTCALYAALLLRIDWSSAARDANARTHIQGNSSPEDDALELTQAARSEQDDEATLTLDVQDDKHSTAPH